MTRSFSIHDKKRELIWTPISSLDLGITIGRCSHHILRKEANKQSAIVVESTAIQKSLHETHPATSTTERKHTNGLLSISSRQYTFGRFSTGNNLTSSRKYTFDHSNSDFLKLGRYQSVSGGYMEGFRNFMTS